MQKQREDAAKRLVISESPLSFWRDAIACSEMGDTHDQTAGDRVQYLIENGYTDEYAARMRVMSQFQPRFWDDGVNIEGKRAQDRAQWCVEQERGMTAVEFKQLLSPVFTPTPRSHYRHAGGNGYAPGWTENDMKKQRVAAAKRQIVSEFPLSFWRDAIVCGKLYDKEQPTAGDRVQYLMENGYADENAA